MNKHIWDSVCGIVESCSRCNESYIDIANRVNKKYSPDEIDMYSENGETYGDFYIRLDPCLSDEEIIIKKIIE